MSRLADKKKHIRKMCGGDLPGVGEGEGVVGAGEGVLGEGVLGGGATMGVGAHNSATSATTSARRMS